MGKERVHKKMFTIFEYLYKIIKNNTNNNTNNKMITKGHYQEKSSIGADKSVIIRILGPDPQKDGYWISDDKKSIPEYILEENYILLYTAPTEKPIKKPNLGKLFEGFKEISVNTQQETNNIIEEIPAHNQQLPIIEPVYSSQIQQTTIQPAQKFNFDTELIEKLNIDKLNKANFEKFGENKFTKQKIKFEIELEFNYNIDKIKQTCELLDLDILSITKYLVSKTNKDFEKIIEQKIMEYFKKSEKPIYHDLSIGLQKPQPIIIEPIIEPEKPQIIEQEEIEETIIEQEEIAEDLTQHVLNLSESSLKEDWEEETEEKNTDDLIQLGIESLNNFLKNNQ